MCFMMLDDKKQIVNFFMEKNYLVSPDFFHAIPEELKYEEFLHKYGETINIPENPTLLTKEDFLLVWNTQANNSKVSIITQNELNPHKREIGHFIGHFKAR